MKIVVLSSSPRRDGNSHLLAESLVEGAREAGHDAGIVELNDVMSGLLRDCRACRRPDGSCSIEDGYSRLIHEAVVPADALVYATPLYWYGMAAALKNYFDRMVCYVSASYPRSAEVVDGMVGKRAALLISAEESYRTATAAVVGQLHEMSRYLRQDLVAVVNGVGNRRGEVRRDPSDPVGAARDLGRRLFDVHHSDYTVLTERARNVWPEAREPASACAAPIAADGVRRSARSRACRA
jgi:multimeric flavodoxin WrbA